MMTAPYRIRGTDASEFQLLQQERPRAVLFSLWDISRTWGWPQDAAFDRPLVLILFLSFAGRVGGCHRVEGTNAAFAVHL